MLPLLPLLVLAVRGALFPRAFAAGCARSPGRDGGGQGACHGLSSVNRHTRPALPTPPGLEGLPAPQYFTQYLANPAAGKAATKVHLTVEGVPNAGYAGFFAVNTTVDNNLYAWYFPAQNGDANAPLLIWLQGGPGGTSLFGLFVENGPYTVEKDNTLSAKKYTWNSNYAMLFIDNPVGAGFSYTGTGQGYHHDQTGVSADLMELLRQFYIIFPETAHNDLYITGESYAGHYIPALGAAIYAANAAGVTNFPLKGVSIGDGWTDPIIQLTGYPAMMFNLGLSDDAQTAVIQQYCDSAVAAINAGNYTQAFVQWDAMLNGDIYPYPNYFHNITGSNDYDNFLRTNSPDSFNYFGNYVNLPQSRALMHTGNLSFNDGHLCELNLVDDVMRSYKSALASCMDNGKVLLYNGQLDLIVGVPLTELYLPTIPWRGAAAFEAADRVVWKVKDADKQVAGYVRTAGAFSYAVVRGAGHIVPYDQGRAALDLLTRFIENKPFTN